jgi:hypothetical protein
LNKIDEVSLYELRQDYYNLVDILYVKNAVGGKCHIVCDDGNVEDHHIQFCIDLIEADIEEPKWFKLLQLSILQLLLSVPKEDREFIQTGVYIE